MSEITIEPTPLVWTTVGHPKRWTIGSTFFVKRQYHGLSDYYNEVTSKIRRPIVVMCPHMLHWEDDSRPDQMSAAPFCIDSFPTPDDGQPEDHSKHWDLTVDLATLVKGGHPMITVSPSIHLIGIWHGWLQEGVLHN